MRGSVSLIWLDRDVEQDGAVGRFGRAEEVAATVEFLADDDAGYFVGATLNVNGGLVTT